MDFFNVLDISSSALQAERQRAEVTASNMANAETTHTSGGGPYRRKSVVFGTERMGASFASALDSADAAARGVHIKKVVTDSSPVVRRFDPGHPDADTQGYVAYPNINPMAELVDLMGAARSYALNISAVQSTKDMILQTLQILT